MTISWRQLEGGDEITDAWREVGASCGYATFFHTATWADAFCSAVHEWQPAPVVIEFADGNLAVLPILRRLDSEHRQSVAPYVYGGPLFLRPPEEVHMDEIGKIPQWYSDIMLYDNPFSPYPWEQEGLIRWRIHTHVVDLSPGFDKVISGCRRMIRQHCRAAERAGISVSVAQDLDEVNEYFDAYLNSLRRWGDRATSCYPRSLFHEFFRLQQEGRGVRLWVAGLDGRIISGVVVLYHGDHAVAWHAATHSDYLSMNGSSHVHMSAIRAACAEGFRWYDFNPSGHLRGVEFFKESFGAERRRFNMYHSPEFTRDLGSSIRSDDRTASNGPAGNARARIGEAEASTT